LKQSYQEEVKLSVSSVLSQSTSLLSGPCY